MRDEAGSPEEYRILVLAPNRRDREATRNLLNRAQLVALFCSDAAALSAAIGFGAGAVLLTDAVFSDPQVEQLLAVLSRQPSWSDIPTVMLCRAGIQSSAGLRVLEALRNVTVLERPSSSRTIVSSLQAALRARARQYQQREQFEALRTSEEQLRVTEASLRDADHRKDLFLATLAHELRNPLAPIRNAAQILTSPRLAPEQLAWVQTVIQRQAKHMALLLDDLLDVARITQDKLNLKKEFVTLSSVVEAAVEAARPVIERKQHELVVTLPPAALILHGDPIRLSQVLLNLLTNAAKYTDQGGQIRLHCESADERVTIAVRDNGIGIAPDAMPRIFLMFAQVDEAVTRSEGGLGIGLSLVKGITELHGGTVSVRSDGAGLGSEFALELPLANSGATLAAQA